MKRTQTLGDRNHLTISNTKWDHFVNLFVWSMSNFAAGLKYLVYQIFLRVDFISENILAHFLSKASISLNGKNPWDIQVHDRRFYARVIAYGTVGFGESYLEGWWDCEELDVLYYNVFESGIFKIFAKPYMRVLHNLRLNLFNMNTKSRARQVADTHYDIDKEVFELILDPSMNYSCAYWKTATDLTQAQIDKMELIGQKLKLAPGMRVLDIGVGYGGIDKYLAERFKVSVVGYTISEEMAAVARQKCKHVDVEIIVEDYRNITGKFDRIFSIEMIEHVGQPNYKEYFGLVHKCLAAGGLFLLQCNVVQDKDSQCDDGYFCKVFPNLRVPRREEIALETNRLFVLEDLHNLGLHYERTLTAWASNLEQNRDTILAKHGLKFCRFFKLYFKGCAGQSRARGAHLYQFVFSKCGGLGGYDGFR